MNGRLRLCCFIFLILTVFSFDTESWAQSATPSTPGPCPDGKQVAFRGAEGFGRCAQGGRGGRVIEVTNLNDSGPGTLRQCAQVESGPRTCVFRVSGTISLKTFDIDLVNPFLTIAGQTAPGGGITLKDGGLINKTHDVIIRYLRVRPGPASWVTRASNANGIGLGRDSIVDHSSISWGTDDLVYAWGGSNVTLQWSIVSEALHGCSGCGSRGFLVGFGATRVTAHHNLFAHNFVRAPEITSGDYDMVNNMVYNYNGSGESTVNPAHGPVKANYQGNYYKDGPSIAWVGYGKIRTLGDRTYSAGSSLHVLGNIGPLRPNNTLPETAILWQDGGGLPLVARFPYPQVTTTDAFAAKDQVLTNAGAVLPLRDSVDTRIINDVKNGTGRLIRDPSDVGGWPVLSSSPPPVDTDHDGMPDAWELARSLNPTDPSDGPADTNGDGYTNLEEYLHNPMASGTTDMEAPLPALNLRISSMFWFALSGTAIPATLFRAVRPFRRRLTRSEHTMH